MLKRFSSGAGTFSALALFAFSTSAYAAHFKTGLWNVSETLINTGAPSSPSLAPVQVCMPDDILESYVNAMLAHRNQDLKNRFKECKDADSKISETARESSFVCDDPSGGNHLTAERQVSYSDDTHLMTITSVESSGTNDVKSLRSVSVNKYEWVSSDCGNVTRALQMPGALAQKSQENGPSAP